MNLQTQNVGGFHINKRWREAPVSSKAKSTNNFSVSGGGVDTFDLGQIASVTPQGRLEVGSASGLLSWFRRSQDLSQVAEKEGLESGGAGPNWGQSLGRAKEESRGGARCGRRLESDGQGAESPGPLGCACARTSRGGAARALSLGSWGWSPGGAGRGRGCGGFGVRHSFWPLALCWLLRVGPQGWWRCDRGSFPLPAVLGP